MSNSGYIPAPQAILPTVISRHAGSRLQQRGLPRAVIEWLQQFGAEEHDGCVITIGHRTQQLRRH